MFILREIIRVSFLFGLNFINQDFTHFDIVLRAGLRISAATSRLSTILYRLVSSVKSRMFDRISVTMSFLYNRNNRGPKMDPCGTPALIQFQIG